VTSLILQPSEPGAAPAPAPTPEGGSPAGGGGGGFFGGGLGSMLFLLLPVLLIFWMTRSQNKKQKDLEESLKVGDRVVTRAGMIGKVTKLGEKTAEVEIAPGVFVAFLKTAIEGKDASDPKAADKDKDKKAADKKDEKENKASKASETKADAGSEKGKSSDKEKPSPKEAS
jgi:preprotein translocase subunit YajC